MVRIGVNWLRRLSTAAITRRSLVLAKPPILSPGRFFGGTDVDLAKEAQLGMQTAAVLFVDLHLNAGPTAVGPNWRTYVADFTGAGRADSMDMWMPTGNMWRHTNDQNPNTFFDTFGNGTGLFWMHPNSSGTGFGGNYGSSPISSGGSPNWRILGGQQ